MQLAAPHTVPADHSSQLAAPLHTPVVPQLDASVVGHSSSGSVPATTGAQVPSGAPVRALVHAEHVPPHALPQHTPSTQYPLAHSEPAPHADPLVRSGTHAAPSQK